MKKIIILGPIGNYGGRDVEVNIIVKALMTAYNIEIVSTGYMTKKSFALKDITDTIPFTTLDLELNKKDILLKTSSFLNALKHSFKEELQAYTSNGVSKKYLSYYNKRKQVLFNILDCADMVILTVQLSSLFLKEVILHCSANSIKTIVRTTGTIFGVSESLKAVLGKVDLFIHHSMSNAKRLNQFVEHNYQIIDQCSIIEQKLLDIEINVHQPLRYGYLGRLSEEKQIIPLVKNIKELNIPLVIAGDGEQRNDLLEICSGQNKIQYIGLLESDNIELFFNKIDILIIASKEETGPLVGIEAMAAGKIIISTKVGAMPERLQKSSNQFWFSFDNLDELEPLINRLQNSSANDLIKIATENRKLYLENYSNNAIFEKYNGAVRDYLH